MNEQNEQTYPQEVETNPVIIYKSPEIRNGHWFIEGQDTGISAMVIPQVGANGNWIVNGEDTGISVNFGTVPSISNDGFWKFGNYTTNIRAQFNFDSSLFTGDGSVESPISLYDNHNKSLKVDLIVQNQDELPETGTTAVVIGIAAVFSYTAQGWQSSPISSAFVSCGSTLGVITSQDGFQVVFDPEILVPLVGHIILPDLRDYTLSQEQQEQLPQLYGSYKSIPKSFFDGLSFGGFWAPSSGAQTLEDEKFYLVSQSLGPFVAGKFIIRFEQQTMQFDSPFTSSLVISDNTRFEAIEAQIQQINSRLSVKVVE